MTSDSTKADRLQPSSAPRASLFADWFDAIETSGRERVQVFLPDLISEELEAALGRQRYARQAKHAGGAAGHRHGSRSRTLLGSFGKVTLALPRARLVGPDGKSVEWKSQTLP